MKKFIKKSLITLEKNRYLTWIIFLAPMLNFLSGMSIDLYAPSLPSMATYFQTSIMLIKNTITIAMLGFCFGCIIFGPIMDSLGRRITIMANLLIFICISLLAIFCEHIGTLMAIRFLQGMMIGTFSIASRALLMDHFEGKRFMIAVAYLSIAYGSGPVIAPFLGGILQTYFSWKANFVAFALIAASLLSLFFIIIPESLKIPQHFSLPSILKSYLSILSNKKFITGTIILGGASMLQIIFPMLGPFVVEETLGKTPMIFGYTALMIGLSYLLGTIINRVLLHHFRQEKLIAIGFVVLTLSMITQWLFSLICSMGLFALIFPIFLICGSIGLIFPNILGICLKIFPNNTGTASAVQMSLLVVISSAGIFIVSHFNAKSLIGFTIFYSAAILFQLIVYLLFFRKALQESST